MKPTAVDLFCGAGGLSLGLEEAGFETAMALDNDEDACATYRAAFVGKCVDLRETNAVGFNFTPWRGVDLVAGGPPCQPFSTGGLRQGKNDERDLLPVFVRAVLEIEPRAFLLENVPGLMSPTHLDYLRETLAPLFERYTAFGPVVLNAAHFGVPQNRRRMVVIGMRGVAVAVPGSGITKRRKAGEVLTAEPKGAPNPSKIVYAKTPDLRPDPYHGQLFNGGGRPIDLERPAPTILASAGGLWWNLGDGLIRRRPWHRRSVTSTPSLNVTPSITFGN